MVREDEKKFNIKSYMTDMIIMLSCLSIMGVYLNGTRAILILLICVLSGIFFEGIVNLFIRKNVKSLVPDLSTIATSLMIALCMPVSVPFFVPVIGVFFAVVIGKIPFGNSDELIFVPAAVGLSFLSIAYSKDIFTFKAYEFVKIDVIGADNINALSLAGMLKQGKSIIPDAMNLVQVLIGRITGPIGTTAIILFLGCFIYLAIKRREQLTVIFFYLFAITLVAIMFPRVYTGRKMSIIMEISAGYVLFGSVFMLSDLVTSPKNTIARGAYGFFAGLLTMLFRHLGHYEDGVFFVVILMNATSDVFERIGLKIMSLSENKNKKKGEIIKVDKRTKTKQKKNKIKKSTKEQKA